MGAGMMRAALNYGKSKFAGGKSAGNRFSGSSSGS